MRIPLALSMIWLMCGCGFVGQSIPGSGLIREESRPVDEFSKVSFGGSADIKIVSGGAEPTCSIRCDDNLLEFVSTEVIDNELRIRLNSSSAISPTKGLQIEISVPALDALELSGSSTTAIAGLSVATLRLQLSGSHELQCEGQADQVVYAVAGSCKIQADKLQSKSTAIHLSGSGSIDVQASEKLDVKIAGSGTVRYLGDPVVNQSIAGVGTIERIKTEEASTESK